MFRKQSTQVVLCARGLLHAEIIKQKCRVTFTTPFRFLAVLTYSGANAETPRTWTHFRSYGNIIIPSSQRAQRIMIGDHVKMKTFWISAKLLQSPDDHIVITMQWTRNVTYIYSDRIVVNRTPPVKQHPNNWLSATLYTVNKQAAQF